MRLQEKIQGHRIGRRAAAEGGGWLGSLARPGNKVDDELPLPHHSGYVQIDEKQPVREHQKLKP